MRPRITICLMLVCPSVCPLVTNAFVKSWKWRFLFAYLSLEMHLYDGKWKFGGQLVRFPVRLSVRPSVSNAFVKWLENGNMGVVGCVKVWNLVQH